MSWSYQLLHAVAFTAGLPYYALTRGGAAKYRQVLGPRFGRPPLPDCRNGFWIQAVSVGEVGVARILLDALAPWRQDRPVLVTTTTATGQEQAHRAFPDAATGYFPFDFTPTARDAVSRVRPALFAMIETEIWPGVLEELDRAGIPSALVNARISDRSFPRYRAISRWLRPTFGRIDLALAASAVDGERLEALGLPGGRIRVVGNLKFDRPLPEQPLPWEEDLRLLFDDRPVLVAGSTTAGEEARVLAAFRAAGGGEKAGLVLAPRHPPRFEEVAQLLEDSGLKFARRSSFGTEGRPARSQEPVDVLLLDTLGELGRAYVIGCGAFVGGSLPHGGGHNPIEPAGFGLPVAMGPGIANFRDVAEQLRREGGLEVVDDEGQLGELWAAWIARPRDAASAGRLGQLAVAAARGAASRSAAALAQLAGIGSGRGPSSADADAPSAVSDAASHSGTPTSGR